MARYVETPPPHHQQTNNLQLATSPSAVHATTSAEIRFGDLRPLSAGSGSEESYQVYICTGDGGLTAGNNTADRW